MDEISSNNRCRRIGVLPIDGFAVLSYASSVEPFRGANQLSQRNLYEIINITANEGPVKSSGSACVLPQALVGDDLELDYLFVVAGGDPVSFNNKNVFDWLGRMARSGVRLGGVSGGPVILARAGLMDGRRMTMHWEHAEILAEISPDLLIERTLYVIDRDRVTCAGGTAPLDLMHVLIAQHHGSLFARKVSDWFLHTEIRPPIGPQRGGLSERVGSTNPAILGSVEMMESHIADPLTLRHLAAIADISSRQLNRLFTEKLGRPTMRYYRELRLDQSQKLLRNSSLSLTEIALATGFAGSSHFSRVYAAHFGQPPSRLRQ